MINRLCVRIGVAAFLLSALPTFAEAASITLTGVTTACFGSGCSSFTDVTSSGNMTFDGDAFSLTLFDDDTYSFLGTLGALSRSTSSVAPDASFTLRLDFDSIGGVSPDPGSFLAITSVIGAGNVKVDFPGAVSTFTFTNLLGTGLFGIAIADETISRGTSKTITPTFTGTEFTAGTSESTAPVPEPGSLMLLGSGLVAAASVLRRRLR